MKQDHNEYYHSRIEEINEHFMILAMPMHQSVPIFLTPDTPFYGSIVNESGRYQFKSIYKAKKIQPIPVWVVTLPTDMEKIQLRSFVRLDINVNVALQLRTAADNDAAPQKLITHNISGGGLCLLSKIPLEVDTQVDLVISLDNQDTIRAAGVVVRVDKHSSELIPYLISIKFVDIIEQDRSKIIKFIFQKQVERKRKGF